MPREGAAGDRTVPVTVLGMATGSAPIRYHRQDEGQEQDTEYNAHRHLDVPFGVLQIHQQGDHMVAQSDPEGDGADGKEAAGPEDMSLDDTILSRMDRHSHQYAQHLQQERDEEV